MQLQENKDFLTTQIITYLGNKRDLLSHIEHEVELISQKLKKEKLVCADLFSGSGIVARMLKSHAEKLIVNDLENYLSQHQIYMNVILNIYVNLKKVMNI